MAELKRRRSLTRRTPLGMAVPKLTPAIAKTEPASAPAPFGSGIEPLEREPDVVRQFMRDHPEGSIPDLPDDDPNAIPPEPLHDGDGPLPDGETPESVRQKQQAEAEAPAAPQAEVKAEPPKVEAAKGEVKAEPAKVEPAAASEPSQPSEPKAREYDPLAKIQLTEDPRDTWTVHQAAESIREAHNVLRPKAEALDRILRVMNQPDPDRAIAYLEPYVKSLQENPARAPIIDKISAADPATINYVDQLLNHFPTLPPEQRAEFGEVRDAQAPAQPQKDQRIDRLMSIAMQGKRNGEASIAARTYPFFGQRGYEKATEELERMASTVHAADVKAGVDPLDARGILYVLDANRAAYEELNRRWQREHAPPPPAPAAVMPPADTGAQAPLPSAPPEPPGARATQNRTKDYRGKDPVAAFLRDHPRQ